MAWALKTITNRLPKWRRVGKKLLTQCAAPAFIALLYTVLATPGADARWPDYIKNFFVTFFMLMWFVGQIARASKQDDDDENFRAIHQKLDNLSASIAADSGAPVTEGLELRVQAIPDPVTRALLTDALTALQTGLNSSAVITAAVAFEHALRVTARAKGLTPTAPVARLIQQLRPYISSSSINNLHELWFLRNRLIHKSEREMEASSEAKPMFEAFLSSIELLSKKVPVEQISEDRLDLPM